jgi:hypothetical protein
VIYKARAANPGYGRGEAVWRRGGAQCISWMYRKHVSEINCLVKHIRLLGWHLSIAHGYRVNVALPSLYVVATSQYLKARQP